jgi:hypothetical protein
MLDPLTSLLLVSLCQGFLEAVSFSCFCFFVGLFSVVCFLSTDSCLVFVVDDNTAKYPCYSWNY